MPEELESDQSNPAAPMKTATKSIALFFVGQRPADGSALPLPEGWPAESHEEPDDTRRAEKLAHEPALYVAGKRDANGEIVRA